VTGVVLAALAMLVLTGAAIVALARVSGRSGSRGSILISVVAGWLAAYTLWTFVGGLARSWGALDAYNAAPFGVLALGLGAWQYRTWLRAGRQPALAIFIGGQLAWLVIVAAQNGLFDGR
jgi:hypothetical protein